MIPCVSYDTMCVIESHVCNMIPGVSYDTRCVIWSQVCHMMPSVSYYPKPEILGLIWAA